ncbi:MAG: hypothetical protein ACT4P5_22295 [Armatimonadota bacterium]
MSRRFPELFDAAKQHLESDRLAPGEKMVIIADTGTYEPLRDAVYAAGVACGADVSLFVIKAFEQPFSDIPPLVESAMYAADYTFSLLSRPWFYNASSERARGHMRVTGSRMGGWEGIEDAVGHFLALLPGDPAVTDRTQKMAKILYHASIIRVTSRVGTDLTFERGNPQTQLMNNEIGQVNYSPLSIDSRMAIATGSGMPPGEVCSGTLMLQGAYRTLCPGPGIHKSLIRQPVRIQIERGRIVEIARDTEDGVFLHDWFHSWDDPAVYYLDHVNIGLDHRIRLEYLDNIAVHFNYGGILMGFGISFSSNRGDPGVFRAKAHIELQLTGANLFFDDRQILKDGDFTLESGVRAINRRPGTGSKFLKVEGHVLPKAPEFD